MNELDKKEPQIEQSNNAYDTHSDDYFEDSNPGFKNVTTILLIIFALTGFGILGWYGYKINKGISSSEELNVIQHDGKIVKMVPDNPGGMIINDMDKSVYNNLSSRKDKLPRVEKLLPAPEEPIEYNNVAQNNVKQETADDKLNKADQYTTIFDNHDDHKIINDKSISNNHEIIAKDNGSLVNQDAPKYKVLEQKADQKMADLKQRVIEKRAIQNIQPKGYYIQLASLRSQEEAEKSWMHLSNKYRNFIGELAHYAVRKELPGKGIFYRLQAGPFDSQDEARLICSKLIKCNQDCITSNVK